MLISAIVLRLALPLNNSVICSLPDAQDATAALALAAFAPDGRLPSYAAIGSSRPVEFPEIQSQLGAHGVAISTAWDSMLVTLFYPAFGLRSPQDVSADRIITNTYALPVWRSPIPFHSSLKGVLRAVAIASQ